MQTLEYTTIDKSAWGDGAWQSEPDKRQWQDPASSLPCLIVRNPGGALCGYVGVDGAHPLFGKSFSDVNLACHGGLTFSASCHTGTSPATGICHVPGEGEPDHVWWFGFNCAHCFDFSPGMAAQMKQYIPDSIYFDNTIYRNWAYVGGQVQRLAAQLRQAA